MAIVDGVTKLLIKSIPHNKSEIKLAVNTLKRFLNGEAAAEKKLNKLAKQKILQQKSSWRPTQKMRDANLEGKKQAIRDARAMRSAASKADLSGCRKILIKLPRFIRVALENLEGMKISQPF